MVQVLHFIVHSVQGSGTPLYSSLITEIRYSILQYTHYRDQVHHYTVHSLQGSGTQIIQYTHYRDQVLHYTLHSLQRSGIPFYSTLITGIRYFIIQYTHYRDQVLHYTVHSLQGSGTPLYSSLNESAVYWSRDTDIDRLPLCCTTIGGSSGDVIRTYK